MNPLLAYIWGVCTPFLVMCIGVVFAIFRDAGRKKKLEHLTDDHSRDVYKKINVEPSDGWIALGVLGPVWTLFLGGITWWLW